MQMQPQAQPNAPAINPNMPPQMQAQAGVNPAEMDDMDAEDGDIVKGLEEHLNQIPDQQKQFLLDALNKDPETIITVLGIINGPEVYTYFQSVYGALNSASGEQPQQPNAGQPPAPQQAAKPQPVLQPQAKATPMGMTPNQGPL